MGARTCTIVFTDLVGSTPLRQRLGDEAFDVRRRVHDRLLTEAVERGGGELVKHEGDGVMAVFASAADAITCVAAMQGAITRELGDAEAASRCGSARAPGTWTCRGARVRDGHGDRDTARTLATDAERATDLAMPYEAKSAQAVLDII